MSTKDRDYWRKKYNGTTNYTEKRRFRVGSSDPTHWREDELETPYVDIGTEGQKAKPSNFWSWHNRLLLFALLFAASFKIYQHFEQQPQQPQQWHRLPVTHQQQPPPVPAAPMPAPAPSLEQLQDLQLQRQRDEQERHRLERLQREQAKAQAWEKFYQPSAFCREHATVECANLYIRARRAFDAQWQDG